MALNLARRAWLLAALASALLALGRPACADETGPLRVQFGTIALPAFAAPFVARDSGLYKQAGVDVDFQIGRLSQDTVNTIMVGTSDIGFVLAINQILSADKGQKLVSVGNLYGRNGFGVVIARDTGITDLLGLAGHTMLVPGGSYQSLFRAFFTAQGGDPNTLKYILVPQVAAMLATYVGKQADSITTALPFARTGVEAGRPSLYIPFADSGDPEPFYVWVVRPDVLTRKKDQIRRFLAATYAAVGRVNLDPSIAVEPFVKTVPGANADRVVPDYRTWMPYQCAPGETIVGKASLPALATALALYRKIGMISSPIEASDLATNEFFDDSAPVSSVPCP